MVFDIYKSFYFVLKVTIYVTLDTICLILIINILYYALIVTYFVIIWVK